MDKIMSFNFDRVGVNGTLDRIIEIEKSISHALPDQYKAFLLAYNGHHVADENSVIDSDVFINSMFPTNVDSSYLQYDYEDSDLVPLEKYYHDEWCAFKDDLGPVAKQLLAFGQNDFGDMFFIGLAGTRKGQVFYWTHDGSPVENFKEDKSVDGLYVLAPDFNSFIAMLGPSSSGA